jgi:multiple sugar transport system ATP-binding protein
MNLIEDGKTWIGFRPEAFLPKEVEPNGDNVDFAFRITRIEYLGADRLVYGLIDGRTPETRLISKIPTNIRTHIDAGRVYDFIVRRQDIARFEREGGRRVNGGAA